MPSTKTSKNKSKSISSKKQQSLKNTEVTKLNKSIEYLNNTLQKIYSLFEETSKEIYEEHDLNSARIMPLASKMEELISSNQKTNELIERMINEMNKMTESQERLEQEFKAFKITNIMTKIKEIQEDSIKSDLLFNHKTEPYLNETNYISSEPQENKPLKKEVESKDKNNKIIESKTQEKKKEKTKEKVTNDKKTETEKKESEKSNSNQEESMDELIRKILNRDSSK